MLKVLIVLLFSFSLQAKENHPIYNQIIRNKPNINKQYAMKLSNIIYKMSIKYNIPKHIFTAILAQESGYKLNSKAKQIGYLKKIDNTICCVYNPIIYEKVNILTDFGISQIHIKTIERYKFDIYRLTTDLEYSVEAGAIVLSDFKKRYGTSDQYYWTKYNANKPIKRNIYKQLVERYL